MTPAVRFGILAVALVALAFSVAVSIYAEGTARWGIAVLLIIVAAAAIANAAKTEEKTKP